MPIQLARQTKFIISSNIYKVFTRFTHINHPGHKKKPYATSVAYKLEDRYLDEPNYPPVKPKYPPGYWPNTCSTNESETNDEIKLAWKYFQDGQKFHSLKTIQERLTVLAYMNVQQTLDDLKERRTRYSPIYKLILTPKSARMLPFNKYITKTHVTTSNNQDNNNNKEILLNSSIDQQLYQLLKQSAEETISINLMNRNAQIIDEHKPPKHPDSYQPEKIISEEKLNAKVNKSDSLIKDILNTITTILSTKYDHLSTAQYGQDVNIKSYWKRCGFKDQKPRGAILPDTDSIHFQFEDVATYQIKCDKPLKPHFKLEAKECIEPKIQEYAYNPSAFKVFADHLLPMQVPGHWYGDSREFNFLTVYNTTKTFDYIRSKFGDSENFNEDFEVLKSMAITAGHAELTAQAYYLGFSMWKDLTYPLMGQIMLTNGQDFSFATYQLNTLKLWNKAAPLTNLCHITLPERLFEVKDNKVELNENVFKQILNTLVTLPVQNDKELVNNYSELDHMIGGSALRPYLSIHDFENQLNMRRKLFAISLYELVKFDRPTSYLNLRTETDPVSYRPKFPRSYDRITYEFRDIVLDYYPRDYYGFKLVERILLRKSPKQTEKFWDIKHPAYEWATVPPKDTNNIPRLIDLTKF